jgi:hypothetical protein
MVMTKIMWDLKGFGKASDKRPFGVWMVVAVEER